jgi:hypothetical protein
VFGPVEGPLLALLVPSAIISCTGSAGRRPGAGPVRRAGAGGGALRHPTHQPPWSCRAARLGRAWRASVGRGDLYSWWWRSRRPTRPTDSTTGSGPRSADPSRRRRSTVPALPSRCGAGAQPRTLVIRQIRETLLAARLQGGSSMAGARPHRRRRAAASEEVSCLGEQRERSIVPALMWPGRRFRPPSPPLLPS